MVSTSLSFAMLAGLAILVLAIAGLANRGSRPYSLAVLGLGLLATLLFSVRASQAPHSVIVASEDRIVHPHFDREVEVQRARAERQSQIVKNQRLAARMDDAFLQTSPDGATLETYPDGMQISQRGYDKLRSIVRPADGEAHALFGLHNDSTHSEFKLWIIGAPILVLVVAFLALRRRKQGGGSGLAWVLAGSAALVLFGFTFYGSQRRLTVTEPLSQQIAESNFDPFADSDRSRAELARVHLDLLQSPQVAAQRESIESLWNKLTQPKIDLGAPDLEPTAESKATKEELARAAKMILSASAPGADPFTQGWLVNAAKVILKASPKESESQRVVATAPAPISISEPLAQYPVAAVEAHATVTTDKPRPDWVADPPKLVGNTRRFVVSTDPFSTVEECYAALRDELRSVVHTRILEKARDANGGRPVFIPNLEYLGINVDYILRELCPEDDYIETVPSSVGDMKRAYALVEFSEMQDEMLVDRWRASARGESVKVVSTLSALVVAGLAFTYGLLRVDTWTRGYYTKRLFIGVPAAIIAVIALVGLFG